ncbi:transglycosylase SLT domain-containing protein [Aminivibrio sp.]|uniref:transglycosylase SLT domain-containing protein n=1 Tax=Aminivibrio sp. TaxID=1872489 RepID=UPI00345EAC62
MNRMFQKGMAALLVLSAAGFLLTVGKGPHGSSLLPGRTRLAQVRWTGDAETETLVSGFVSCLASSAVSAAGKALAAHDAATAAFAAVSENTDSLSRFIQSQNGDVNRESALVQANAFWKYSLKYNVPLDLIVAVANTESHFRPEARSPAGAAGVMQVMWRVHAGLLQANGIMKEEDLLDPEMGIAAGSLLLSRYLKAYGDTKAALGRYYGGSAIVYWNRISRNLAKVKNARVVAAF